MGNKISKTDIADLDIVDQVELRSDGSTSIISGVTVVSTTSGTRDVVLSGIDLEDTVNNDDERIQPGDPVTLAGTTGGADGDYTVELILSATSFRVVEAILTSTGGSAEFFHPVGASLVGFDSAGLAQTAADNVQDALEDLDSAISAGGLTPAAHRVLDQLVHDIAEDSYDEYIYSGNKVTDIKIWTDNGKTTLIRWTTFTYSGNKVSTIVTKQYDGAGVLVPTTGTLTETYTYSGNSVTNIDRVLS